MNILVTGGAGYIGSHTCLELMIAILEGASPPLPAVVLPTRLVER